MLPEEATDRIASAAAEGVADEVERAIGSWRRTTHEILRAVRRIDPDDWRKQPVGLAIQLVLLRPEPLAFKTWFDDCVDLAPAVAWSAAALCGLSHGYKRTRHPLSRQGRPTRGGCRTGATDVLRRPRRELAARIRGSAELAEGKLNATFCRGRAGRSPASTRMNAANGIPPIWPSRTSSVQPWRSRSSVTGRAWDAKCYSSRAANLFRVPARSRSTNGR